MFRNKNTYVSVAVIFIGLVIIYFILPESTVEKSKENIGDSKIEFTKNNNIVKVSPALVPEHNNVTSIAHVKLDKGTDVHENTNDLENQQFITIDEIWASWVERLKNGDLSPSSLENKLIIALRKDPNEDVYADLYELFLYDKISPEAKQLIISILGNVATQESTQTLYKLINEGLIVDGELKFSAFKAIRKLSTEEWSNEPNYKVASMMEREWNNITDKYILKATAVSMARIGRKSSLDLLSKELLSAEKNSNQETAMMVYQAIGSFRNQELIPELSNNLKYSESDLLHRSSAIALAQIGTVESAEKLLDWAVNAPDSDKEKAREWFDIAVNRSPSAIAVLEKRLPDQKFDSEAIRYAVEQSLYNINNYKN